MYRSQASDDAEQITRGKSRRGVKSLPRGRHVLIIGLGVCVAVAFFGNAASLSQASKSLGASSATVSRCDSDGVTITQNLSGSNVVSVSVAGIASECAGASLSATLDNGSANSTGTAMVPAGGGSVTVTLASAIAAKDREEIDVAITGP
jgi:hypothetical protein